MRCPHCKTKFKEHFCLTEPGASPEEGDGGICEYCGGWWKIVDGEYVEYLPTNEDMKLVYSFNISELKKRQS